uniref:helix-turn-helix domain-containing protein n=1 Tax=Siccirubricoccus deserti TaxID=2013562 RepID=UPI0036F2AA57
MSGAQCAPAASPVSLGVLGPQLRRLRGVRGLTLDALAAAVGLDKGFLSRLERGRRRPPSPPCCGFRWRSAYRWRSCWAKRCRRMRCASPAPRAGRARRPASRR